MDGDGDMVRKSEDAVSDTLHLNFVFFHPFNYLLLQDRQGDISEDETVKFKSYLLSLGIEDPVTRNAYSSGDAYRKQLANQIAEFILSPLSVV